MRNFSLLLSFGNIFFHVYTMFFLYVLMQREWERFIGLISPTRTFNWILNCRWKCPAVVFSACFTAIVERLWQMCHRHILAVRFWRISVHFIYIFFFPMKNTETVFGMLRSLRRGTHLGTPAHWGILLWGVAWLERKVMKRSCSHYTGFEVKRIQKVWSKIYCINSQGNYWKASCIVPTN